MLVIMPLVIKIILKVCELLLKCVFMARKLAAFFNAKTCSKCKFSTCIDKILIIWIVCHNFFVQLHTNDYKASGHNMVLIFWCWDTWYVFLFLPDLGHFWPLWGGLHSTVNNILASHPAALASNPSIPPKNTEEILKLLWLIKVDDENINFRWRQFFCPLKMPNRSPKCIDFRWRRESGCLTFLLAKPARKPWSI